MLLHKFYQPSLWSFWFYFIHGQYLDVIWNFSLRHSSYPLKKKTDLHVASQSKYVKNFIQWFSMKRQHALIVVADNLYYSKFRDYCKVTCTFSLVIILYCPEPCITWNKYYAGKSLINRTLIVRRDDSRVMLTKMSWLFQPGVEGHNCIADEHYLPTFFHVRIYLNIMSLSRVYCIFLAECRFFFLLSRWQILEG